MGRLGHPNDVSPKGLQHTTCEFPLRDPDGRVHSWLASSWEHVFVKGNFPEMPTAVCTYGQNYVVHYWFRFVLCHCKLPLVDHEEFLNVSDSGVQPSCPLESSQPSLVNKATLVALWCLFFCPQKLTSRHCSRHLVGAFRAGGLRGTFGALCAAAGGGAFFFLRNGRGRNLKQPTPDCSEREVK